MFGLERKSSTERTKESQVTLQSHSQSQSQRRESMRTDN
jgi:hypothetical protein